MTAGELVENVGVSAVVGLSCGWLVAELVGRRLYRQRRTQRSMDALPGDVAWEDYRRRPGAWERVGLVLCSVGVALGLAAIAFVIAAVIS